ncbi:MAG: DedA family protein [Succinivibrionaceae bacterium]
MAEKILNWVAESLTGFGLYNYLFAFGILILCGFGLPIPEDITLVAGGLVSGLKATDPHIMLLVCFAGVLLGDSTMYILGRTFGYRIQKFKPIRKILPPRRFAQVQRQFAKHGIWVLFFARFMPGLRSPIFLAAGMSHRIPFTHFILMDGFAALISVPVWVYIGYYFADQLPKLLEVVKDGQGIMHVIVGGIILFIAFLLIKSYIHKKIDAKSKLNTK